MSRDLHRLALNPSLRINPYPFVLAALAVLLQTPAATAAPVAEGVFLSPTAATRASAVSDAAPVLDSIAPMTVRWQSTLDQTITARDPDGDPLTFQKVFGPDFMTVSTITPGPPTAQGLIHLAPLPDVIVSTFGSVLASDGFLISQRTFAIHTGGYPPEMRDLADMSVDENRTADQILIASDADGDSLSFSVSSAPTFASIVPIDGSSARLHLAPGYLDAGTYELTIDASDGRFSDSRTLSVEVRDQDRIPVLAQPYPMRVDAGTTEDQAITATDADGNSLAFYRDSGPYYVGVSTSDPGSGVASGLIHVAPMPRDAPVADSVTVVARVVIEVTDQYEYDRKELTVTSFFPPDHAPTMEPLADVTVAEDSTIWVQPVVADPDGDNAWWYLIDAPDFVHAGDYPHANAIQLTPAFSDSGTYTIHVQAQDPRGLFVDGAFHVQVLQRNAPPSIHEPGPMIAFPGQVATQEIHAEDIDGDSLHFVAHNPPYLTVTTLSGASGRGTGLIRLAPQVSDIGIARGEITVTDGIASSYFTSFPIEVHPLGTPVVYDIADECLHTSDSLLVPIHAVDPEGSPIALTASGLPRFATLSDRGDGLGAVALRPSTSDTLGASFVTVWASDGVLSGGRMFVITLAARGMCPSEFHRIFWFDPPVGNWPPSANSGGPYSGVVDALVVVDGTGSRDAEQQPLSYGWSFGDGAFALGPKPSHAYRSPGTYVATLFVSDGSATSRRSTTVTITDSYPGRALPTASQGILKLSSLGDAVAFRVEPLGPGFVPTVVPSSLTLRSAGTGVVDHVAGTLDSLAYGDTDGNGTPEIAVSFGRDELRQLFALIKARQSVTVNLEGSLRSGGSFRAPLTLTVAPGPYAGTTVYPNPLNPVSTLSFQTTRPGRVRVLLYQTNGRQVGVLYDEKAAPAGGHYVPVGDIGAHSMKLPSGVYFYRIETVDGVTNGRFVVLK